MRMVELVSVLVTVGASLFFFLMGLIVKYLHDTSVAVNSMQSTFETKLDALNTTLGGIDEQINDIKDMMIRLDAQPATSEANNDSQPDGGSNIPRSNRRETVDFPSERNSTFRQSSRKVVLENSQITLRVRRLQRPRSTQIIFDTPSEMSYDSSLTFSNLDDSLQDQIEEIGQLTFGENIDALVRVEKIDVVIPSTDKADVESWINSVVELLDEGNYVSIMEYDS